MHGPNGKRPISFILNDPQLVGGRRRIPLYDFGVVLFGLCSDIQVKACLEASDLVGLSTLNKQPSLIKAPIFCPLDDLLAWFVGALGDVDGFA